MKKSWKKYSLLIISFACLIAWNIYVSLPKKENDSINKELLQHVYKQAKQQMDQFWSDKVAEFKKQYEKDSIFMLTVTDEQLDSLELRYLNRGKN